MYSYENRIRAVELYIRLGKRVRSTIRQLGYPTKNALKGWYRESVVYCRIRNARPALVAPITLVSREDSNSPAEKNFLDLAKSFAREHKA